MVSVRILVILLAAASLSILSGQQPGATPLAFSDVNRQESIVGPSKVEPRQPLSPEMRGDILMARKMYREAVDAYLEADSNSAVLANKIGIAYHQMMQVNLAKKQYEKAIKLNPKYSEAVNNLGTVHYANKSYRRAVGQYNKALKLNPNSASIYSNLGTAQFARKKYKQAMEAYEKALSLDPEVFERRNSHGVLLQERNVQERAKFFFYMAKTYAKAGAVERALNYIRKALEEGFTERDKFREDPEFAQLQENPEFLNLMALEPRVL
jgi:tetratricopeptide (TPR) repeat protein